jgi:hypothetical protein
MAEVITATIKRKTALCRPTRQTCFRESGLLTHLFGSMPFAGFKPWHTRRTASGQ